MRQTKLWMTTAVLLLCSITKMSGEIILTEADGLLATTSTNSAGELQYVYTSPTLTLDEATNTLVFTFLEAHTTTNSLNDKNGYPFVALAEFFLYDGDGNQISLDANNFSTNAQEPKEGPLKNICDNNFTTFFHSMWSTGASGYHNITVTLPEGMELKEFKFKYYTRYTSQCVPKKIYIDTSHELFSEGTCGDNLAWKLAKNGNLVIWGSGAMRNYDNNYNRSPWYDYRQVIKNVTINEGITTIGDYAFFSCEGFTRIEIPEGVERVGYRAFCNCYGLQSIYIPQTVSNIDEHTFAYCNNLTTIVVDEENPKYDSRNNCNAIIETETNTIVRGTANTARVCLENVKSIGEMAFSGCNAFFSYSIPEGVASIGEFAFSQCYGLASVLIPQSVNTINEKAFFGCNALAEIKSYAVTPPVIQGSEVFKGVNMNNCVLSVPAGSKEVYQTADGWKEFSLIAEISEVPGEIILSQGNEPLGTFQQNAYGRCHYYTSPILTLDKATNTIVLTFLEGYSETASINDKNGFPFVALAEFYLYDGNGDKVVLNASNFSTNAQEPKEGPLRDICDNNFTTFFHSMWSTGASDSHNIVITLPQGLELKDFSFEYYTRQWSNHGIPKKISVKAGTGNEIIANGTCGDNLTWELTSGGDLTVSGSGDMYDYSLESNAPWYSHRELIQRVTINEGVTAIGSESFYFLTLSSAVPQRCPNLKAVSIPNSVERIGRNAFYDTGLTSVHIPKGVKEIGLAAFAGCDSLKSVTIGRNVKSIEDLAFSECVSLSQINSFAMAPPQILGANTFYKVATSTCQLNVPVGSEEAYQAADGWKGFCLITEKEELTPSSEIILTQADGLLKTTSTNSVGVKQYVYTSPTLTLDEATSTLVFTFLEGYTRTSSLNDKNGFPFVSFAEFYLYDGDGNEIALDASNFSTNAQETTEGHLMNICDKDRTTFFHSTWSAGASNYHNLIITLPEGIKLQDFSFGYYTRWDSHGIPKKIGIKAGSGNEVNEVVANGTCGDNLTWQLTAGGDLIVSGSGDMYDYNYDAPWYDYRASIKKVTISEGVATIGCSAFANCENLASANIPDGVARIGWDAFWNTNISSVYIPKSVREIWNAAFGDCDNLVSIIVDAENPVYDSRSGCNAIIETSENRLISGCASTIIPDGVVNIAQFAFIGCDNLTSITFPESLNIIEYRAFWTCNGLTSIVIPKRVWHIDQQAFGYCYNLGTISVDSGNLDYDSRDNCNAIIDSHTNTIIRGTANTIIPESVKAIGDFAFSGCLPMKNYNIPEGVTSIGNYAFCQCNNLVSINIPQSVNTIGEYAFYNCYNLTSSIEIPESVAKVNDWTFAYCNKLSAISFPEELISIGNYAFFFCSSLKSAIIPNCVETVGERAFMNCYNLESLSISEGLDTISDYAFSRSDKLKKIVVPKRVSHIGEGAFSLCPILETVTIGKNVQTIGGNAFNQCLSLSQIDSYAVIPPKIVGVGTFYKVNPATCKLNVPVGSKAAYQADDVWKAFKLISEKEGLTSIEQLEASSTSLWPTNIYDMNGRLVRENAHSVDGLTGGVYIINGRKVVINN